MKRRNRTPVDLPMIAVLVAPSGEILDVGAHHLPTNSGASKLKGQSYAEQCSSVYRPAIRELLTRDRQLLSAIMPPPTLDATAWFAVVGVPIGSSKESGALFLHVDITPWISSNGAKAGMPPAFSMDLLQDAMATAFVPEDVNLTLQRQSHLSYEGIESLTKRQREVLKLIAKGKSNIEIAEELSCSLNTVKRHVTAVLQKLKLPNRTRAAMLANQLGDQ